MLVSPSYAVPGGIFKSIFNLFKSGGDDVIKSADDVLRGTKNQGENVINTSDDLLRDITEQNDINTSNLAGYHIYCFNQIETTEKWRTDTISSLN